MDVANTISNTSDIMHLNVLFEIRVKYFAFVFNEIKFKTSKIVSKIYSTDQTLD